jgi:hypothetical protein
MVMVVSPDLSCNSAVANADVLSATLSVKANNKPFIENPPFSLAVILSEHPVQPYWYASR